jgi:hypothetical protein
MKKGGKIKWHKWKTQEFLDSIKRPNLQIMDIEGGEEVQAKRIENICSTIIEEISQLLKNRSPFRYRRILGYPTDQTRKEPL